jgi:hypothetical protein
VIEFRTELKPDKLSHRIWIYIIAIGVFCGIYAYSSMNNGLQLPLFGLSLAMIMAGLLISRDTIAISINGNELIIEKYVFGRLKVKSINIDEIEDLTYRENVKSNVYVSKGHVKVFGMDATPESWKEYYYHPEILSFHHQNRRYVFGKWKKAFNGKQLYRIIAGHN